MRAVYTVTTHDYAAKGIQILEDLSLRFSIEGRVFLFVIGPTEGVPDSDVVTIVNSKELSLENHEEFYFQYTGFEAACALKPFAASYLLREGAEFVTYLDTDIWWYRGWDDLDRRFSESGKAMALFPHGVILEESDPIPESIREASRLCGLFNAGFFICSAKSRPFLEFWMEEMSRGGCIKDFLHGWFDDQKILDWAPVLTDVMVIRDVGHNVGHWNLNVNREILQSSTVSQLAQGSDGPLFFHFSGLVGTADEDPLSSYCPDERMKSYPFYQQCAADYLLVASSGRAPEPYCYGVLDDGTTILPQWREVVRLRKAEGRPDREFFSSANRSHYQAKSRSISVKTHRGEWALRYFRRRSPYYLFGRLREKFKNRR